MPRTGSSTHSTCRCIIRNIIKQNEICRFFLLSFFFADSVRYLILDEADRMLSRGFAPDIDRLRELLLDTNTAMDVPNLSDAAKASKTRTKNDGAGSKSRPQVALLTATMPGPVVKLANTWLSDPERIDISASIENNAASLQRKDDEDRALHQLDGHRGLSVATTDASIDTKADRPQTISSTITQVVHVCAEHKKPTKLLKHLSSIKQSAASAKLRHLPRVLVFVNRIKTCRFVEKHIAGAGYRVAVLHGDRSQSEREQALRDFKAGKTNVLVATDIAARGLDITDLPYVVNYDFPGTMEVYVHRVGRTGRMASQGHAYSFMTREMAPLAGPMVQLLRQHEQSIDPNVVKLAEAYKVAAEKLGLANDADALPGSEVGGADVALRVAKPGTNDVLKELDMKPKRVKKAKRLDADEAHGRGDDHTPVNGRAALTATAREQRSISTSTPVTVVDAAKTRENGPEFIAAKKFLGPRPGYVFKTAGLGVGYYPDRPLHIAAQQGAETAGKGNASSLKRKNVIGAADFRPIGGVGRKKKVDEDATKTEKAQDNVPLLPGRLKQMRKMRRVEEWSSSSDEDSELRAKGRNARGGKRKVAERLSRGKSSLPGRLRKKLSV
jgi:superfamily II DNA/RNA helicase